MVDNVKKKKQNNITYPANMNTDKCAVNAEYTAN